MSLLYILFQEADMLGAPRLVRGDAGQTMAEYAVVLGVITIAVVATLGLLNAAVLNLLSSVIALI
jgi:Flp pilus assembly pilin Flp